MSHKNKESIEQILIALKKSFIDNDSAKRLLKLVAEENEKSRKHELEMMKLMFSQHHPPFQEPSLSIPFHSHNPSSSENSSCFQQISYHQNHVTAERKKTPRIRIFSTICYKHHHLLLQHIILHGLPIKDDER